MYTYTYICIFICIHICVCLYIIFLPARMVSGGLTGTANTALGSLLDYQRWPRSNSPPPPPPKKRKTEKKVTKAWSVVAALAYAYSPPAPPPPPKNQIHNNLQARMASGGLTGTVSTALGSLLDSRWWPRSNSRGRASTGRLQRRGSQTFMAMPTGWVFVLLCDVWQHL